MTYKLVKLVFICFIGIEFTNLKSFWEKPLSKEDMKKKKNRKGTHV